MGRRKEQRAARRAAARADAEHPVFAAPQRAEDAANIVDDTLDQRAGMRAVDWRAAASWDIEDDLNDNDVGDTVAKLMAKFDINEYAKFSKFPRFVAPSGADSTSLAKNKAGLLSSFVQECPAPFSRGEMPSDTGDPSPVSASALTSAELIGMEEDVAMANVGKWWKGKAPRQRAGEFVGHQAGGHVAPESLGFAISVMRRQPKPRASKVIDETLWSTALLKAVQELKEYYGLNETLDEYYVKMCPVGKSLLANEVQRKTQSIYDYKAAKLYQKTISNARSVVNREAPGVSN